MKILHTADWHLGKRLDRFSRLEEQREVMEEICAVADEEQVDVVLVAGDLFDAFNPPTEAIDLYYKTLKRLASNGKRAVIAIAGNHDSPDRIEAPDPLALECGILLSGYPDSCMKPFRLDSGLELLRAEPGFVELKLPDTDVPLRLLLTPYANEIRLKKYLGNEDEEGELRKLLGDRWQSLADKYCNEKGVNILMAHLYLMSKGGEKPEEPEDEKPILHIGGAQEIYTESIPKQIQYTALGHLHRYQKVRKDSAPVVYSSSPLAYSFSEADQDKYVVIIEANPGEHVQLNPIKLKKGKRLYRKRFEDVKEALDWLHNHQNTLVELTMATDEYLNAADRKALFDAHDGIVSLIPEVKSASIDLESNAPGIDLSQDLETLFKEFFKHRNNGQEAVEEIMSLFKEVLAENNQ